MLGFSYRGGFGFRRFLLLYFLIEVFCEGSRFSRRQEFHHMFRETNLNIFGFQGKHFQRDLEVGRELTAPMPDLLSNKFPWSNGLILSVWSPGGLNRTSPFLAFYFFTGAPIPSGPTSIHIITQLVIEPLFWRPSKHWFQ